jgi:hypothetical protein
MKVRVEGKRASRFADLRGIVGRTMTFAILKLGESRNNNMYSIVLIVSGKSRLD